MNDSINKKKKVSHILSLISLIIIVFCFIGTIISEMILAGGGILDTLVGFLAICFYVSPVIFILSIIGYDMDKDNKLAYYVLILSIILFVISISYVILTLLNFIRYIKHSNFY